jgi:uncharacterized protein involved in oxidation of intracellular sulfur
VKTLFILNDPPYGTERSYNGLRLAGSLANRHGEEVRVFLMGQLVAPSRQRRTAGCGPQPAVCGSPEAGATSVGMYGRTGICPRVEGASRSSLKLTD